MYCAHSMLVYAHWSCMFNLFSLRLDTTEAKKRIMDTGSEGQRGMK